MIKKILTDGLKRGVTNLEQAYMITVCEVGSGDFPPIDLKQKKKSTYEIYYLLKFSSPLLGEISASFNKEQVQAL